MNIQELKYKVVILQAQAFSPLRKNVNVIRLAARDATETMIDEMGMAYYTSKDPNQKEQIIHQLVQNKDVYNYIRGISIHRMMNLYPSLDHDKIEEIVQSALVEFFDHDGVGKAIRSFNPTLPNKDNIGFPNHKGWQRFATWVMTNFFHYDLKVAWDRYKRDMGFKKSRQEIDEDTDSDHAGIPTPGNANPSPYSINEQVGEDPRYNQFGSGETPEFQSYDRNPQYNYHALLREVNDEIQVAEADPKISKSDEGRRMLGELIKLRGDLIEIVRAVEGDEAAEAIENPIYRMPDRNKKSGLQDGGINRKRTTVDELGATVEATERFFDGLPESIMNLIDKRRLRVNKMYTNSTSVNDPAIKRKVSEALIAAMMVLEAKLSQVGRGYLQDADSGNLAKMVKTKGGINTLYAKEAAEQMNKRNISPEIQAEVLNNISNENELVRRPGDMDEFRRHFTYNKLSEGLDPAQLAEDQLKGIVQNAFQMLGYDKPGARPYGRSIKLVNGEPTAQNYLSQAPNTGFDPNEFQSYMGEELSTMLNGNPNKKAKLPQDSSFIKRRDKVDPYAIPENEIKAAALLMDRLKIAMASETLIRCAKTLDSIGKFRKAEQVEKILRTAVIN